MKNLSILGSTGSIGTNALEIAAQFSDRFKVRALAAKNNILLLARQIETFRPEVAVVFDEISAKELKSKLVSNIKVEILFGEEGYKAAASLSSCDMVVAAMVGSAGLIPTLAAIDSQKTVALANKETLVMAGDIIMNRAAAKKVKILPIDSEHSAIFQCLSGNRREDLSKILLTGSGGPFLDMPADKFSKIRIKDALNHPTWQMGKKISIDSATMMNKGLEIIEAKHLFGVSHDMIEVLIHPQSIVHSMVAYKDGSIIAQLSVPDMKGAIALAMSYPERLDLKQPLPDFINIEGLTFRQPDLNRFPCLGLAFKACEAGGTYPCVLNAANEVAVNAFFDKKISFVNIFQVIEKTCSSHNFVADPALSDIFESDVWARKKAEEIIRV